MENPNLDPMDGSPESNSEAWTLVRYTPSCRDEWDRLVQNSRQGTFLFLRDYMDYEAERFVDHSLLCYGKGRLQAVLPAIEKDGTFNSHGGLTYGGFLTTEKVGARQMLSLFSALNAYLSSCGCFTKVVYRPVPYIYSKYPADEDLYALWRLGARLTERKLSSALPLETALPLASLRRRGVHKALKAGLQVVGDEGYSLFWPVLEETLRLRHATRPVHTLDEMRLLSSRFPARIRLYRVVDTNGLTVGGTVVYLSDNVAHAQYIAASDKGRRLGALDLLFSRLMDMLRGRVRWFDFGNSVEQGGRWLNEGLVSQKEGFGGRAVMYDTYEWNL